MAEKLHFSLVSPERELFSGLVDQVDAPGSEGGFGVLAVCEHGEIDRAVLIDVALGRIEECTEGYHGGYFRTRPSQRRPPRHMRGMPMLGMGEKAV